MPDPKSDGGPAFPGRDEFSSSPFKDGMSLRGYFAGQALAGLCRPDGPPLTAEEVARRAWGIADAMLKAREAHND